MTESVSVKGYRRLAAAVVHQAVLDYRAAAKDFDIDKMDALEKWFVSDWAQLLSDDLGGIIAKKCKENYRR